MGVYYVVANHTRKEYVCAHDLGFSAKYGDWCVNQTAGVILALLGNGWECERVQLVGDDTHRALYAQVHAEYANISYEAAREFNELAGSSGWKVPESREEHERRVADERERQAILLGHDPAEDTD